MIYKFLRNIFKSSVSANTMNEKGISLMQAGRLNEAENTFRALTIRFPRFAPAYGNLGMIFINDNRFDDAINILFQGTEINPNHAGIHSNLAIAYYNKKQLMLAIKHFKKSIELKTGQVIVYDYYLASLAETCQWKEKEKQVTFLMHLYNTKPEDVWAEYISPYGAVRLNLPAELQKRRAIKKGCTIERSIAHLKENLAHTTNTGTKKKIRLGYLSVDFQNHPVAFQTLSLYRTHNRQKFEVFAFSLGKHPDNPYRSRIEKDCDHFFDLHNDSDHEAAQLITSNNIDILIDLSGYTRGARPEILAYKPAPIQVTYLGYPSTMGADFIDYIIADEIIIPPKNECFFTEKIVHLPNSFMICDNAQSTPTLTTTREKLGLTQESFVYCCFCQSYKITRQTFETWMRILDAVPHGLLWLQHNNEWADDQLRKQALHYGIDPERLVFAKKTADRTSYMAQYMAADLFLDTQIYNAHSTACEALWAGLPIVTCSGETYATRVVASLLSSVGLTKLIAENMIEYENIAIKYAQHPDTLRALQQQLIKNRSSHPLFDTAQSVANLETAYSQMWSDLNIPVMMD